MKRAAIVFHSVCGNTWLLAREYQRALEQLGVSCAMFRVPDPNFERLVPQFQAARECAEGIRAVPVIEDPAQLLAYDALFFGSPTYFGNVSAAMKAFMDACGVFWTEAALACKRFGAFSSAGTPQGAGDVCLLALNVFAQHMGMLPLPVPANIAGRAQPAYGVLHFAGELALERPDEETRAAIFDYLSRAVAL